MRKKRLILTLLDVPITFTMYAVLVSFALWLIFFLTGTYILDFTPIESIIGALFAVLLHWISDVCHQLGHAWVARQVGYPMREIRLVHILAASIYPKDEPELPAETHIRRALGGPPASFLLGLVGGIISWAVRPTGGMIYAVALFFFIDNALVLGLGAFLPLGFTDGSTLLKWLPKRGEKIINN